VQAPRPERSGRLHLVRSHPKAALLQHVHVVAQHTIQRSASRCVPLWSEAWLVQFNAVRLRHTRRLLRCGKANGWPARAGEPSGRDADIHGSAGTWTTTCGAIQGQEPSQRPSAVIVASPALVRVTADRWMVDHAVHRRERRTTGHGLWPPRMTARRRRDVPIAQGPWWISAQGRTIHIRRPDDLSADGQVGGHLNMTLRAAPGPFPGILRCSTLTERPAACLPLRQAGFAPRLPERSLRPACRTCRPASEVPGKQLDTTSGAQKHARRAIRCLVANYRCAAGCGHARENLPIRRRSSVGGCVSGTSWTRCGTWPSCTGAVPS
jgi:hypothetical protein